MAGIWKKNLIERRRHVSFSSLGTATAGGRQRTPKLFSGHVSWCLSKTGRVVVTVGHNETAVPASAANRRYRLGKLVRV